MLLLLSWFIVTVASRQQLTSPVCDAEATILGCLGVRKGGVLGKTGGMHEPI